MDKEEYERRTTALKKNISSRNIKIEMLCKRVRGLRSLNENDSKEIDNVENAYLFGGSVN